MDKAGKVIRRSGIRLKSLGCGHSDLNMVISELKNLRQAAKVFMTAQNAASQDMVKWATCDENRAVQDVMNQLAELNSLWTDVQKDFIEHLKVFKTQFELILDGERQVDIARNHLVNCEQREQKIKKELKQAAKKATEDEISNLEVKLSQAERAKYLAQLEVVEQANENEVVKLLRLKDGLLNLSGAYVELAHKCAIIFEAQSAVSHYLPDVHGREINEIKYTGSGASKLTVAKAKHKVQQYKCYNYHLVPSTSIKEDRPPPYTPGFYNPATGRPYDDYVDVDCADNHLSNQTTLFRRQRAVAAVSVKPSCPPCPSSRASNNMDLNTSQCNNSLLVPNIWRDMSNYEDEFSGAMGATKI